MELERIIKHLKDDISEYKAVPFWSWNGDLEADELRRQTDEMQENDIGGYIMHARGGLKTEYLSDEWMDCIETCGDYCNTKNMNPWIYDENGWPSGFAGGKLLDDECNRDMYIVYSQGEFDPNSTVSYIIDGEKLVRIRKGVSDVEYLNVYLKVAASTADIINGDVVDKFINLTHEAYKARLGQNFNKKYKGFFTDEPQYQRWHTPYSVKIADYFREVYGEDILDSIGLLFVEKKGYRKFRYRYWKAMQELMISNFSEKIYNWCEENGVELTGHYVEESNLAMQMMCCGGIMPFYKFEHIPGIDWLGNITGCELSPRQVTSVTRQMGKRKILTESFACCGWQVTPTDLKRILDFQYVNGVNILCHHLVPYAEYGQRKRDYPAHYSAINPWVRNDFAAFNRYAARLGYLVAESDEFVNVAVLHPIRSAYFDYKREEEETGCGISELDKQLPDDLRKLSSVGINYHFLDETLLSKHGFVNGNKIGCGKCAYDFLVLPHIITMDSTTEKLLYEYCKNGGRVLIMGDKPEYVEADDYSYDYLDSNCNLEDIITAQPYSAIYGDTSIFSTYRTFEGKDFIIVTNTSFDTAYTQTYLLKNGAKSLCKLDIETFQQKTVPLTVTLDPGEGAILFLSEETVSDEKPKKEYRLRLDSAKVEFSENNLTVDTVRYSFDGINFSKQYPCAGLFEKFLKDRYEGEVYLKYEFEVREIPEIINLKAEDCKASVNLLNGKEFKFTGVSPLEKSVLTADIRPLLKLGKNEYVVKRNWYQSEAVYYALFGENVTESLKNCLTYDSDLEAIYLSGKFGVYSECGFTNDGCFGPGSNHPSDKNYTFANDFYIGQVPTEVSEPVTDGFPFFAGNMRLTQKVHLDSKDVILRIDGTQQMADVSVNGDHVGKLLFGQTIDISEFAEKGENIISVDFVISNRNYLGPHHSTSVMDRMFVSPYSFELTNTWSDGESPLYSKRYEFLKLGISK
ncbi:MAG: glycosyl hydrolase [Oscillospiraceae bacterium]|nr:glycosyl hydrolase [Oscillospiraceae bacterium]